MKHKAMSFFILLLFSIGCGESTLALEPIYLDQGWNKENNFRKLSYYTTQGSRLIPYTWFLALEQHDNEKLFKDPIHIKSLGLLTPSSEELKTYKCFNPDGLPIGFVKDPPFKDSDKECRNFEDKNGWMGFNCSTCHTGQVNYKGKTIRIDGGATMADLQTFLEKMNKSLINTLNNAAKFERFAEKVTRQSKQKNDELRKDLKEFTEDFSKMVHRSVTPDSEGKGTRYGYARLDAFGGILNEVIHNLNENTKRIPPDAPVSYPFIWDAPKLDWVQWNGAVNNPIARNAGEVVGVFGDIVPSEKTLFTSSARLEDLFRLEEWLKDLNSPKWPEEHLPKFVIWKKGRGKEIYKKTCEGCHSLPSTSSKERITDPSMNFYKKTFVKTHVVGLKEIGTDPMMALNFAKLTLEVGPLADPRFNDWKSTDKLSALEVLEEFVKITITPKLDELKNSKDPKERKKLLEVTGFRIPPVEACKKIPLPDFCNESPSKMKYKLLAYKARPLNGIWATAPYLHNGSIPNMTELLKPPQERAAAFCVGSQDFDSEHIGFEAKLTYKNGRVSAPTKDDCGSDLFWFDTKLPGNRNTGHDFSKNLNNDERQDLLEFLKTL